MIASIEAINLLYVHLRGSAIYTDVKKPNGKLCKLKRPENSVLEDIVINSLGNTRTAVQRGALILNVYVPNLNPNIVPDIGTDRSQPDTGRMLYLSKLVQSVFTNVDTEESQLWIDNDTCFEIVNDDDFEDENNQHYVSFRIDFYTIK